MHSAARRRPTTIKPGGDAGRASVSESMKGGAKVFNANKGGENNEDGGGEEGLKVYRRLRRNQSDGGGAADAKRRRNWKPPESPVQLRKSNSALPKITIDENSKRENLDDDDQEVREKALVVYKDDSLSKQQGCNLEIEEERKSFDDKEIDLLIEKSNNVHEQTGIDQIRQFPDSSIPRKEIDFLTDSRNVHPDITEQPPTSTDEEAALYEHTSTRKKRMQGFVDLIMWRNISKSALVFGFGTFFLLSTSYSKDINFSFISAISYLGLVYLAIIFLFKSIIRRGAEDVYEGDENYIVGEEEAVWVVKLVLPYMNEFLIKIKALFTGDPATTMKLAALLFVLARCGNCITTWTLVKLVFFGVFTIPKILSSYSLQLAKYGNFWLERFKDGWESCTHKKAVAAGIFILMWNLSSTVARVWAVFMLVVGVRLYQQYIVPGGYYCNGEYEGLMSSAWQQEQEDSGPDPGPKVGSKPLRNRRRLGPL